MLLAGGQGLSRAFSYADGAGRIFLSADEAWQKVWHKTRKEKEYGQNNQCKGENPSNDIVPFRIGMFAHQILIAGNEYHEDEDRR